jgi:hypothetical protein
MNHRFNELRNVETTITKAVNAVSSFTNSVEKRELSEALNIIAEVRHTAMFLCDNPSLEVEKEVTEQLVRFIKG